MSEFPKTIRVGSVDYAASIVPNLRDGSVALNGHIVYNDTTIEVEEAMTDYKKWVTVWHECLHGVLEQAGWGDHEETMITALGYGVTQLLRDNPWLRQPPQMVKE